MPGPANLQDLVARSFRPLSQQEENVGEILLDDAWNIIVSAVPNAANRVTDTSYQPLLVQVQCSMVLRVLKNPDGKLEERIDDYQWRRDSALSSGALYLSDAEKSLLGAGDGVSEAAFTIQTRPNRSAGWWVTPDQWVAGA